MNASTVTRKLRQAGVTVTAVGRIDYRNGGISYYHSSEHLAREFYKDVAAAGFTAHIFRGRVTVAGATLAGATK